MNDEHRKNVAIKLCYSVTPDNVEQIYKRNFTKFLFENSDEVEINGKVYGNSIEDKITRACFMFPNEQGESNIKTAKGYNTKGGFPLTELDFIDNQLFILKDLSFSDLVQRKKHETYLNFIQNKKTPPQPEPIFDEKTPTKNLDTIIWHYETFKGNLFLNGKNRLKAFEMLDKHTSHKDILKPHLAIQELKKLITTATFKDTAKYYLDKAKQVRKSIEDLIEDLINKNILEPFDYNQFNIDVLRHLDTFIIEVETFAGLSEIPLPKPILTNTPQQQNIKNQFQKEINHFFFFQIEVVGNIEIDGKIYENQKQLNNDSIITTENWNERKLEFFMQRMDIYDNSFSLTEKIVLEIELLNKFEFKTNQHKILKNRYLDLLNDKLNNKPHPQTQESEIKNPFSITGNFELFKYLDKMFKPESKVKYTYIFDFIKHKEKLEPTLNEKLYFEYIAKLKPHLGLKTFRPQPSAMNYKKEKLVEKLYQDYLNETTK